MSPPTLGPDVSQSPTLPPTARPPVVPLKRASLSSGTSRSFESSHGSNSPVISISRSSSTSSILFLDGEPEVVKEDGVNHISKRLHAKRYKTAAFAEDLLQLIFALGIPSWSMVATGVLSSELVSVQKVSGSLTNAVFFVSCPSLPTVKTILLRIYGASSSSLISRPRELHTLHILSSQHRIGPRVYGTFENGRLEEYFPSQALTPAELRNPTISGWIGARMAELHCVDIEAVEQTTPSTRGENVGWEIGARKNIRLWLKPAHEVLALPGVKAETRDTLDLNRFVGEWETYMRWLTEWESIHGPSKRVFAHNDTQYGNLLKLNNVKEGVPAHRQIIVVDFEYAGPNSAAFDIANHFHEWTANYHSRQPHILDPTRYPNEPERRNFYRSYLANACPPFATTTCANPSNESIDAEAEIQRLDEQVKAWSPASHAMWAVWGIVQAREDIETNQSNGTAAEEPEFDYIGYATCRIAAFRREISALEL